MGQYYKIINVDKKKYIDPFQFGNGCKLLEWSFTKSWAVLAMVNKMAEAWKGDRVYVIGDYATPNNPEDNWYPAMKKLKDEFHTDNMYKYSCGNFEDISLECSTEDLGYRYIYNHATRQYIDLDKCPIEWVWYDPNEGNDGIGGIAKFSPLSLLLAAGNGRGGGDYLYKRSKERIGSWCDTSASIEVRKNMLSDEGYKELKPDFSRHENLIPYTKADEMFEAAKQKAIAESKTQYIEEYDF